MEIGGCSPLTQLMGACVFSIVCLENYQLPPEQALSHPLGRLPSSVSFQYGRLHILLLGLLLIFLLPVRASPHWFSAGIIVVLSLSHVRIVYSKTEVWDSVFEMVQTGFKFWLPYSLAVYPHTSYVNSLNPIFLICKQDHRNTYLIECNTLCSP